MVPWDQLCAQSYGGHRNVNHENYLLCVYLLGEFLADLLIGLSVTDCGLNFNPSANLKSFVFLSLDISTYPLTILCWQTSLTGSMAQCSAAWVAISQVLMPVKVWVPSLGSDTTSVLGTL